MMQNDPAAQRLPSAHDAPAGRRTAEQVSPPSARTQLVPRGQIEFLALQSPPNATTLDASQVPRLQPLPTRGPTHTPEAHSRRSKQGAPAGSAPVNMALHGAASGKAACSVSRQPPAATAATQAAAARPS